MRSDFPCNKSDPTVSRETRSDFSSNTKLRIFSRKIRTRLDLLSISQSGGKMSERLNGINGCKDKKNSYDIQTDSPMVVTLGQQHNVGEKPTVILHTC